MFSKLRTADGYRPCNRHRPIPCVRSAILLIQDPTALTPLPGEAAIHTYWTGRYVAFMSVYADGWLSSPPSSSAVTCWRSCPGPARSGRWTRRPHPADPPRSPRAGSAAEHRPTCPGQAPTPLIGAGVSCVTSVPFTVASGRPAMLGSQAGSHHRPTPGHKEPNVDGGLPRFWRPGVNHQDLHDHADVYRRLTVVGRRMARPAPHPCPITRPLAVL